MGNLNNGIRIDFYALMSDGRFVLTQRYGLQHVLKKFSRIFYQKATPHKCRTNYFAV